MNVFNITEGMSGWYVASGTETLKVFRAKVDAIVWAKDRASATRPSLVIVHGTGGRFQRHYSYSTETSGPVVFLREASPAGHRQV